MENLWPCLDKDTIQSNNAIQILREQARNIQSMTDNKIRATFSKLSYKPRASTAVEHVGKILSEIAAPADEEILENELMEKKDANNLFSTTQYKFEIFNEEYRFRLFVLNNSDLFPISLDVDGGILEDVNYKNKSNIESDDELKSVLKEIFGSNKVKKVIAKLLESK